MHVHVLNIVFIMNTHTHVWHSCMRYMQNAWHKRWGFCTLVLFMFSCWSGGYDLRHTDHWGRHTHVQCTCMYTYTCTTYIYMCILYMHVHVTVHTLFITMHTACNVEPKSCILCMYAVFRFLILTLSFPPALLSQRSYCSRPRSPLLRPLHCHCPSLHFSRWPTHRIRLLLTQTTQ